MRSDTKVEGKIISQYTRDEDRAQGGGDDVILHCTACLGDSHLHSIVMSQDLILIKLHQESGWLAGQLPITG